MSLSSILVIVLVVGSITTAIFAAYKYGRAKQQTKQIQDQQDEHVAALGIRDRVKTDDEFLQAIDQRFEG